jgi:hypothetical protein
VSFWLDIVLENPIEAGIALKNFVLCFRRPDETNTEASESLARCEMIDEIFLLPKERRTVDTVHFSAA